MIERFNEWYQSKQFIVEEEQVHFKPVRKADSIIWIYV